MRLGLGKNVDCGGSGIQDFPSKGIFRRGKRPGRGIQAEEPLDSTIRVTVEFTALSQIRVCPQRTSVLTFAGSP